MPNQANKCGNQKTSEANAKGIRSNLGPFFIAAENTRMATVFTNAREPDNPIIFASDSFLALTGYDRDEVLGQSFNFLMVRGADPDVLAAIEGAFEGSFGHDVTVRYCRGDDSVFWAIVSIQSVDDEAGGVVQHCAFFIDITRHMQDEDRLRLLLDVLNHSTQNMLATVLGISSQTLRGVADKEVIDTFEGRVVALSKAHGLLGRVSWQKVGLVDVIDQVLETFGLTDRNASRFFVKGDNVRLISKTALTLAVVFHDLATNAVKHGAFSNNAAGQVEIAWQAELSSQGDRMRLRWR